MTKKQGLQRKKAPTQLPAKGDLIQDLRLLIDQAKNTVAVAINSTMTALYWRIGYRIHSEILKEKRADYGKEIVASLSRQLTLEYGGGFAEKYLRKMIQFAEVFPDEQIVASLMRQLSWSHFLMLIPLKDPTKRDFYAEMCRIEKWNTRTLRKKIDSMLYERTALSRKPETVIRAEIDMLRNEELVRNCKKIN